MDAAMPALIGWAGSISTSVLLWMDVERPKSFRVPTSRLAVLFPQGSANRSRDPIPCNLHGKDLGPAILRIALLTVAAPKVAAPLGN